MRAGVPLAQQQAPSWSDSWRRQALQLQPQFVAKHFAMRLVHNPPNGVVSLTHG